MSTSNNTRVVIADDHPLLLQGLKEILLKNGFQIVGLAGDGISALKQIVDEKPDLAILDVEMPYLNGFGVAEECSNRGLKTKFIMLSYHKEAEFILRAQKLNISGYLLKEDTSMEITLCISNVLRGESHYSKSILNENIESATSNMSKLDTLSPSEKKILKMIATQFSSQEIADKLHVSERTIEKHRSNIISKLGLSGQAHGLSLWACEQKSIIINL